MKFSLYIFLHIVASISYGQNLVPNPSFEDTICCPQTIVPSALPCAGPWFPATLTPDYMHICSTPNNLGVPSNVWGSQSARTGFAYAGFYSLNLNDPPYWFKSSPTGLRVQRSALKSLIKNRTLSGYTLKNI